MGMWRECLSHSAALAFVPVMPQNFQKLPFCNGRCHSRQQFGNFALHILTAAERWQVCTIGPFQAHVQWLLRGLPQQVAKTV